MAGHGRHWASCSVALRRQRVPRRPRPSSASPFPVGPARRGARAAGGLGAPPPRSRQAAAVRRRRRTAATSSDLPLPHVETTRPAAGRVLVLVGVRYSYVDLDDATLLFARRSMARSSTRPFFVGEPLSRTTSAAAGYAARSGRRPAGSRAVSESTTGVRARRVRAPRAASRPRASIWASSSSPCHRRLRAPAASTWSWVVAALLVTWYFAPCVPLRSSSERRDVERLRRQLATSPPRLPGSPAAVVEVIDEPRGLLHAAHALRRTAAAHGRAARRRVPPARVASSLAALAIDRARLRPRLLAA